MRLLLPTLLVITSSVLSQQQQQHQQSSSHASTVSRQYPTAAAAAHTAAVSAYHTPAAAAPATTQQQQRSRSPYPTQSSYRAPQRKQTPRGQAAPVSNHVPILAKAVTPTRMAATVAPVDHTRQQQQQQQAAAAADRRRQEEQHRKNAEKARLDQERRRQSDEKKRAEQERKHRQSVEAAERQRVEQARIKAEEERKRADDETKRRTDEELRRKATENERLRAQHAAAHAAAAAQREQQAQKHVQQHHHQQHQTPAMQLQQHPTTHHTQSPGHPIQMADPRNHYNSVPLLAPAPLIASTAFAGCDMPPDLWCDSREAAAACGVEQQCQRLRRKPIKITLIYEALCPFCQRFISNQLGIVFNSLRGHFELDLVPWGNSRLNPDGSFSCNHGQKECDANRLQSCVLDQLQVKGALPFIVCFEKNIFSQSVEQSWRACTAFVRSHEREIRHCYDTEKGVQLQRVAAQKTFAARPQPIVEVPYLLINDYSPTTENNDLNVMLFPQLLGKWAKIYNRK